MTRLMAIRNVQNQKIQETQVAKFCQVFETRSLGIIKLFFKIFIGKEKTQLWRKDLNKTQTFQCHNIKHSLLLILININKINTT